MCCMARFLCKEMGHRPESQNKQSFRRRTGLRPHRRLDSFQPSVFLHRRKPACDRSHPGGRFRMDFPVLFMDPHRRRLLWSRHRLRCSLCERKNDGKSMGLLIEKSIGRLGREAVPGILLALHLAGDRGLLPTWWPGPSTHTRPWTA